MAASDQRAGQILGRRSFLVLLGLLFATCISALTQTTTSGGLTGMVTDPSKAVVPDADVEIKDNAKGTVQSTKTDRQGVYRFFFVAPGRYMLIVSHPGFREENEDVNVLLGPPGTRNITLAIVGEISTVNVTRLKGKQPRVANMLVEDHLRPAAVKVGVLKKGEKVRFGFHNLRHSLASFRVRKGTDVKTVQQMLRHSDVATTLGIYAHRMSEDRLAAQDDMLAAMMTPSNGVN
jgi:hypothetical protein